MKLKTLKDFEAWDYGDGPLIDYKELRLSAIEWIKAKERDVPAEFYTGGYTRKWIKHFFNLTDEDLK